MFSHEPQHYVCPFCSFLAGKPDKYSDEQDIVYRNEFTTAFIAPKWWANNAGHVLVVPNKHVENIYNITDDQLAEVYKTVKGWLPLFVAPTSVAAPRLGSTTSPPEIRMCGISMYMYIHATKKTGSTIITTSKVLSTLLTALPTQKDCEHTLPNIKTSHVDHPVSCKFSAY